MRDIDNKHTYRDRQKNSTKTNDQSDKENKNRQTHYILHLYSDSIWCWVAYRESQDQTVTNHPRILTTSAFIIPIQTLIFNHNLCPNPMSNHNLHLRLSCFWFHSFQLEHHLNRRLNLLKGFLRASDPLFHWLRKCLVRVIVNTRRRRRRRRVQKL